MKKRLTSLFLVILLVLGAITVAQASNTGSELSDYEVVMLGYERKVSVFNCDESEVERQLELLLELNELLSSGAISNVVSYSRDGEPVIMPQISLILPPTYETDMFGIGLEIDIGELGFGDLDEIAEIASREVSEYVIDFIAYFSGIPRERVSVSHSVFMRTPLLPYGYIPSGICPVWGDERIVDFGDAQMESLEHDVAITPFSTTIRMGNTISIRGVSGTAGHPTSSAGTYFISAFHSNSIPRYTDVFLNVTNTRVGLVFRSIYNQSVDITGINTLMTGASMSTALPLPLGGTIGSFRGSPRNNDEVISIRAMAGVYRTRILNTNAFIPAANIAGMMVTTSLGGAQAGDSGAALIRTTDRAVMGTHSGGVFYNGSWRGLYTNVQRY